MNERRTVTGTHVYVVSVHARQHMAMPSSPPGTWSNYTRRACPEFPTGTCVPTCASTTSRHAWQCALQRHWWRRGGSLTVWVTIQRMGTANSKRSQGELAIGRVCPSARVKIIHLLAYPTTSEKLPCTAETTQVNTNAFLSSSCPANYWRPQQRSPTNKLLRQTCRSPTALGGIAACCIVGRVPPRQNLQTARASPPCRPRWLPRSR